MGKINIINKILFIGLIIMATMMLKEELVHNVRRNNYSRKFRRRTIKPYRHYQYAGILNDAAQKANKYLYIDNVK